MTAIVSPRKRVAMRCNVPGVAGAIGACIALWGVAARGDTLYWDGAPSVNWETASNWSMSNNAAVPDPATPPGTNDTAFFSISSDLNGANPVLLTGDPAVYGVTINASNTAATILRGSGGDRVLTVGPGGLSAAGALSSANANAIGSSTAGQKLDVRLNGSQTWIGPQTGDKLFLYIRNAVRRQPADTTDRTLLFDVGYQSSKTQTLELQGNISDGGASGALALWKTGCGTLSLTGANTHSGGTVVNSGTLTLTPAAMPTNSPLILRGGHPSRSTLKLGTTGAVHTHNDVRIEAGVNLVSIGSGSTFNMGTVTHTGGTLVMDAPSAQVFVGNSNDATGIVGPWLLMGKGNLIGGRYACVTNGALAGYVSTFWPNDGEWNFPTPMSPLTNYEFANTPNNFNTQLTLTNDAFANTMLIWTNYNNNNGARIINLGETGDYDLTINGLASGLLARDTAGWQIVRSGDSTGRLIIGHGNDLVLSTCWYEINVPIVDHTNGVPGKVTLATRLRVVLAGESTYSGGTDFCGTDLRINSAGALGTGPLWINGSGVGGDSLPVLNNTSPDPVTLSRNNAQVWNTDFAFAGTRSLNMGTGPVSLGISPGPVRTVDVRASVFSVGGIADGTHAHLPTTALTKTGAGTLELTGASTFTGATAVKAGKLKLGADASLTSTDLRVESGADLHLTSKDNLANDAVLDIYGVVTLDADILVSVGRVRINGVDLGTGSFGSTTSAAGYKDDTHFSGDGLLVVGKPGLLILVL